MRSNRPLSNLARPSGLLLVLFTTCLTLLSLGCGKEQFEFVVTDQDGGPLPGGTIFYFEKGDPSKERTVVGETDAEGSLIVSGKHLSPGTWYLFERECAIAIAGERFDPQSCAIITGGANGRYRFSRKDGLVRRADLRDKLSGKGWPGRRVKLSCEPIGSDEDETSGRRRSLTRILDITSTAGAEVRVNGRNAAWIPESGWLNDSFCPGDSAACFAPTVMLEIRLQGFDTYRAEIELPAPAGRIKVDQPLVRAAAAGGDEPPPDPRPGTDVQATPTGYVRVRIANQTSLQACGQTGETWPTLHVNNLSTAVASISETTDWKAYYDLLLVAGKTYRVALECPQEGQAPSSWSPWDKSLGQPLWFTLKVPTGVDEAYWALPTFKSGETLEIAPGSGSWRGFRQSRATRIN